jgi:hypothetical protein
MRMSSTMHLLRNRLKAPAAWPVENLVAGTFHVNANRFMSMAESASHQARAEAH